MNILGSLERISFKKIFGLTFLLAICLGLPVTIWVSQQETRLASQAKFEKPEVIKPVKKFGAPSPDNPKINLIWPFLGKVGDAVLIEGENFGDNPLDKQLILAGKVVPEENINNWTQTLIEFTVPQGAVSGLISFKVAGNQANWPYWFTVYDLETKIQVTENNDIVRVLNAPPESKAEIIFSNGDQMETDQLASFNVPADKTIMSVIVKDKMDNPLPFFVEPSEFNF